MFGLLGWLGGFWGPAGDEYVESEARAVAQNLGRGHFSTDPESAVQQILRVLSTGQAFIEAWRDKLVWNANPALAVDLIGEWEAELGLTSGIAMTLGERQARCRAICRRSRKATSFGVVGGSVSETLNDLSGGRLNQGPRLVGAAANAYYEADVWGPAWGLTPRQQADCLAYLEWVTPANAYCALVLV